LVISSGRGDGPAVDAATLLASLGIDLDQIRHSVTTQFGPNAMLDSGSPGITAVLKELRTPLETLRAALIRHLRTAS
jgi:hypothetical protein